MVGPLHHGLALLLGGVLGALVNADDVRRRLAGRDAVAFPLRLGTQRHLNVRLNLDVGGVVLRLLGELLGDDKLVHLHLPVVMDSLPRGLEVRVDRVHHVLLLVAGQDGSA